MPAIAWLPGTVRAGSVSHALTSVMDVAPTILDLAQVDTSIHLYPNTATVEGHSLLPLLNGKSDTVRSHYANLAWETWGERAIISGDWKALKAPQPWGNNQWQLFDLRRDFTESNDVSQRYPSRLQKMQKAWQKYAERVGVVLP